MAIAHDLGLAAFHQAWKDGLAETLTEAQARAGDPPRPGCWMIRLVRGGPEVPARIYRPCPIEMHPDHWEPLDRVFCLVAEVGGREQPVARMWNQRDRREITLADFDFEMRDLEWARRWAPQEPKANPYRKVDHNKTAIPSF
jgi:hypothetical protein